MANEAFIDVAIAITSDGSMPFDTVFGETVKEPQFHRFQDMPLELRQQVYKEYFLDEQNSICRGWPRISLDKVDVDDYTHQHARDAHIPSGPSAQQFFPNICLVNRNTGFEAARFLISMAELAVGRFKQIEPVISKFNLFRGHHLLDNVHILTLPNLGCIYNYGDSWAKESPLSLHRHTDHRFTTFRACMHLISQCPQLRGLDLSFIVGFQNCFRNCGPFGTDETHQTLSFEPVFACKELHKLNLTGDSIGLQSKADIDQVKKTIYDMEQWFMDEFVARGKKVDVQAVYLA
jgi:hypothetical protein